MYAWAGWPSSGVAFSLGLRAGVQNARQAPALLEDCNSSSTAGSGQRQLDGCKTASIHAMACMMACGIRRVRMSAEQSSSPHTYLSRKHLCTMQPRSPQPDFALIMSTNCALGPSVLHAFVCHFDAPLASAMRHLRGNRRYRAPRWQSPQTSAVPRGRTRPLTQLLAVFGIDGSAVDDTGGFCHR